MKKLIIFFVSLLLIVKAKFNFRSFNQCKKTFCGGISSLKCCQGYECHLDGDYSNAGGECILGLGRGCATKGEICGGFAGTQCCRGVCNYRPGADHGNC